MKTEGKVVIKGCRTPRDEESHTMKVAKESLRKCKEYEKKHKFIKVPILNGYRMKRVD